MSMRIRMASTLAALGLLGAFCLAQAAEKQPVQLAMTLDKTHYAEGESMLAITTATNVSDAQISFMGILPSPKPERGCFVSAASVDGKIYTPPAPVPEHAGGALSVTLMPGETISLPGLYDDFLRVNGNGNVIWEELGHHGSLPPGTYVMQAESGQYVTLLSGAHLTKRETHYHMLRSEPVEFVVHPKGTKLQPTLAVTVAGKPLPPDQKVFRFLGQAYIPTAALASLQVKIEDHKDQVRLIRGTAQVTLFQNRWVKAKAREPEVLPYLWGYLPVCKVASALGLRYDWDEKTKTLSITAARD